MPKFVDSYTQRLNAFKATTCWTVEKDGVRWEELDKDQNAGFIPFEKITKVRLRYEPSRAETRRVGLHIYAPYDYPISNIHYRGVMDFEARTKRFAAFVRAFHARFPADSAATFHKGSTPAAYAGNIALSVFILLMLLLAAQLMSLTGVPGGTSVLRLVIILVYLPILFRLLRKNRPTTYHPDSPPEDMLT